jgi:hypothetical protein
MRKTPADSDGTWVGMTSEAVPLLMVQSGAVLKLASAKSMSPHAASPMAQIPKPTTSAVRMVLPSD